MALSVDEAVRPGDLEAGDVISLADEAGRFLVRAVRLGQGGFIVTVEPADGSAPGTGRQVTLTTAARGRKFGPTSVL